MSVEELRALEVEEEAGIIDRTLRERLQLLVGFAKSGDIIVFKDGFNGLSDIRKVVTYHLARLALRRLRGERVQVEVSTDAVAAEIQVPEKSCMEYHSRLKSQRLVDKTERGWFIPPYAVARAAEFVAGRKRRR